jgi:hypothetical protein
VRKGKPRNIYVGTLYSVTYLDLGKSFLTLLLQIIWFADQDKLVRVSGVKESGGVYVYSVTCLGVGESILTLTVGNKKSATLPRPVTRSSTIKVGRQSKGLGLSVVTVRFVD